jgi:hypothetical protein
MVLLKGGVASSSKTCVTSTLDGNQVTGIEADWVTNIKEEEEDQEQTTIPEIRTELKVSVVPAVNICTILVGYIQNCLPLYQCFLVKPKFVSRE